MNETALREHVLYLLDGGGAHLDFEAAVARLPPDLQGAKPTNLPHSPWQLVEHMRICQWDIVEFSTNANHVSPNFPDGYWPSSVAPPDDLSWLRSLSQFRDDIASMRELVQDPSTDLLAEIPHGNGQPFCAKRCWWQITTHITLASWSWSAKP